MTEENSDELVNDQTLAAGSDVVAQIRSHAEKARQGETAEAEDELAVWTPDADAVDPDVVDVTAVMDKGALAPPKPAPAPAPAAEELTVAAWRPEAEDDHHEDTLADTSPSKPKPAEPKPATDDQDSPFAPSRRPTLSKRPTKRPTPAEVRPARRPQPAKVEAPKASGGSLIDGLTPPTSSATYWSGDNPLQPTRTAAVEPGTKKQTPLLVWVLVAIALIVVASVAIAVALAATGLQ